MAYERTASRGTNGWRIRALRFAFLAFIGIIGVRLFVLQVVDAAWYKKVSQGQHSIYEEITPVRGSIFVKDYGDDTEYAVATNEPRAFFSADPRLIVDPVQTGLSIAKVLQLEGWDTYGVPPVVPVVVPTVDPVTGEIVIPEAAPVVPPTPTETENLIARLSKTGDPYEPIARDVRQEQIDQIVALDLPGVDYFLENARDYPEANFGGQILGFLGRDSDANELGMYGLEGYFQDFLAGRAGSLYSQTDAGGRWTGVGTRTFTPAVDGGDFLLTIDRTVQYMACKILQGGVQDFGADSGTLVIVEPKTGRVLAMCGSPDFDPNEYGSVTDASVYNNEAIFEAYEPGSVFKPITIAAAIDAGVISPHTTFEDTGEVVVDDYTIRNSDLKAHGLVTMTTVLDESLNTGMVWIMRKMGREVFERYVHAFRFGETFGIELDREVEGTIASLDESAEVYAATASFGQGLTTTPLQIASAYAAIANGGAMMKPYIVDEVRYPDGTVEERQPEKIAQVVSAKTATTVAAMLVSVVENGHGKRAGVDGYYIAGKTGTAQVAGNGGYLDGVTNGTFAGFGPVGDPRFAMVVKFNNPRNVEWAESSAAPIFGEIAQFLLQYYDVPPERQQ